MEAFITYLFKVSIAIALFYGLHMVFLRNETFLKLRRTYFLLALGFSLIFPFVSLDWMTMSNNELLLPAYLISEIAIFGGGQAMVSPSVDIGSAITLSNALFGVAVLGSAFLLIRFLLQLIRLVTQLKRLETEESNGCSIITIDGIVVPSFSFFRWIVINTSNISENQVRDIICHEEAHAKQLHSVDVILYEIFCILFWWNPFAWLLKKEMKLNLEYLADHALQEQKDDLKDYQYTLLQISIANTGVAFINNFNVSHLKERITMMNKKKSSILCLSKYLLALPLALALVLGNVACGTSDSETNRDNTAIAKGEEQAIAEQEVSKEIFTIVEEMPSFPGGEKAMMEYIGTNLEYPEAAKVNGVQGRVVVRFVVQVDGSVSDVELLRGVDTLCDNEALRVVKSMPNWTPGKQNGKDVAVYFTLPILFRLK